MINENFEKLRFIAAGIGITLAFTCRSECPKVEAASPYALPDQVRLIQTPQSEIQAAPIKSWSVADEEKLKQVIAYADSMDAISRKKEDDFIVFHIVVDSAEKAGLIKQFNLGKKAVFFKFDSAATKEFNKMRREASTIKPVENLMPTNRII